MSGLYNVLFNVDPMAKVVVTLLDLDQEQVPRFRDAWVDIREPEPRMVVLTRAGGGNRPDYEDGIAYMRSVPGFLSDEDEPYDTTYALFYYQVPEQYREPMLPLAALHGRSDMPGDRWQKLMLDMIAGAPEGQEAVEKGRKILGPIIEAIMKK
jgi:hypothetical protein